MATRSARRVGRVVVEGGLAWLATYVESVRQVAVYAERISQSAMLGGIEEHITRVALGECLAQILGGVPMSQGKIGRLPADS